MALDQLPPQPSSARPQAAQFPNNTDPTRASRHLPLDVVHSIFAFYHLEAADVPNVLLSNRSQARNYHRNILHFAGVCQSWYAVVFGQLSYVLVNNKHRTSSHLPSGQQRLWGLLHLFKDRGPSSCVKHLSYRGTWGTLVDIPVLSEVVDTVKATLTCFKFHLLPTDKFHHDRDDDNDTDAENMRLLSRSLSGVERLEELEMRAKVMMPLAEYVKLFQSLKSLRQCNLDLHPSDHIFAYGTGVDWRTFPHTLTPWHQLTTLITACTDFSAPLLAIILTSGTITHLQLLACKIIIDIPDTRAVENLWSAMEAHCTSLTSFVCHLTKPYLDHGFSTLDHLLPFLTSCTDLEIGATDLTSLGPLFSLSKLKSLKVNHVLFDGPLAEGLTVNDWRDFVRQEQGVLKYFEIAYYGNRHRSNDGRTSTLKDLQQLKREAASLNIEFLANEIP